MPPRYRVDLTERELLATIEALACAEPTTDDTPELARDKMRSWQRVIDKLDRAHVAKAPRSTSP